MATAYAARFAYPADTFEILASLRRGEGPVCEIGAGTGRLTRGLARRVGRVDAIEPSQAMVDAARAEGEPGDAHIRWIVAPFETAPLDGPYSLVVASDAIHWLDWSVSFPRIDDALEADAFLALVTIEELEPGTAEAPIVRRPEVIALINAFSTNHEYERYDLMASLGAAAVFEAVGSAAGSRVVVTETIEHAITRLHSMNGLAPAALGDRLGAFDDQMRDLLRSLAPSGEIATELRPIVRWGYPRAPGAKAS